MLLTLFTNYGPHKYHPLHWRTGGVLLCVTARCVISQNTRYPNYIPAEGCNDAICCRRLLLPTATDGFLYMETVRFTTPSHDRSISYIVCALIVMERYFAMFAIRYRYIIHDLKQRYSCCRQTYGRIYLDSKFFLSSRSHLVMNTCVKTKLYWTLYCTYWRIFKAPAR